MKCGPGKRWSDCLVLRTSNIYITQMRVGSGSFWQSGNDRPFSRDIGWRVPSDLSQHGRSLRKLLRELRRQLGVLRVQRAVFIWEHSVGRVFFCFWQIEGWCDNLVGHLWYHVISHEIVNSNEVIDLLCNWLESFVFWFINLMGITWMNILDKFICWKDWNLYSF